MSGQLPALFPGLQSSPFHVTSPGGSKYNCIAWAANDSTAWWWPTGEPQSITWPAQIAREVSINAFAAAFAALGYVGGANESLEVGVEKIAFFADVAGTPTHAARQLPSGLWTSKLGQAQDIKHELRALEGEIYGRVVMIMKRPSP